MQRVFRGLAIAGSVAILVAVVLGFLGHFIYELDMLAHFRLHFLILCAPMLLFAGVLRLWAACWRLLIATVLATAGLGGLWQDPERPGGVHEVVVAAANLYQNNGEPDAMKRALLDADADVLVTMETTKTTLSGPGSLALKYPYRLSLGTTGQILRTVIWSKFPMRDGRLLLEDQIEPTGAHAVIQTETGVEFTILGVHFAHNVFGNQKQQIEALDRIASGLARPLVVIGDFNATAWSYALRRAEELTGARRVGGFAITWQGAYPSFFGSIKAPMGLQIDHALVSESVGVDAVNWLDVPGSDHRMVIVSLRLP